MDHVTHMLSAYHEDRKWIAFCKVCSREGDLLKEPCPGKFISMREIDVYKPSTIEKGDVVGLKSVDMNKEPK